MEKKNEFNSKAGFILAAAGSSIGLGNLWSFPYKASQNGGAAFVFAYIISVIILGSILAIAEIYIGKRSRANPITSYKKISKYLGWVGVVGIFTAFIITCYYIVLGGYTIKYTVNSFSDNSNILESFSGSIWQVILFTAIFIGLSLVVVSLGVKNGIEKSSKILMPALIVILIGVVIYCLTLGEGVKEGLNYYLNPDFKALGFKGILAAMSQAFFSLSVGAGSLITYGSYTGKDIRVGKSVLWIAFFDTLVAFLAGLAIFPSIYHYQIETGIALQNNGIVLLFSSMPIVFSSLGTFGKVISFFFFGMVSIAAITSVISLLEVVAQYLIQRHHLKRKIVCMVIAIISLVISIPIGMSLGFSLNNEPYLLIDGKNLLEIIDLMVNSVFIPANALLASIAIGWLLYKDKKKRFGFKYLSENLEEDGLKLGKFRYIFAFMIKFIIPILVLVIEVIGIIDIVFPLSGSGRSFSLTGLIIELIAFSIIGICMFLFFVFLKDKDTGTNDNEYQTTDEISNDNKL